MRKTVDSENANTDYMLQEAYKKSVVTESRIRYVENSLRTLTDRVNDGTTESLINSIDQLNRKTNEINNTLKTKADINHTHNNYATKTELSRYATTQQLNRTEQELQRDMNTKINDAKDELNNTIDSTKEELTQAIDDNVKTINESIASLEQDIGNKAELSHTHTTADITDLNMSVYAPAQHTHVLSNITDLDISNYATVEQLNNKADINHTHTIDNISDLQTSLDGKANTSHTHTIQDITGFDGSNYVTTEQLDTTKQELTQSINEKANSTHTHVIADVTDLQNTLDGKASADHTHSTLETLRIGNDDFVIQIMPNRLSILVQRLAQGKIQESIRMYTNGIGVLDKYNKGVSITQEGVNIDDLDNNIVRILNTGITVNNTPVSLEGHTHDEYITKSQMLELLYPIGSLYVSMNNTNPNTVLGIGTWTQITDRFLYCANSSGTNGGNSTATLTVDNLPSHNHTFTGDTATGSVKNHHATGLLNSTDVATGVFQTGEDVRVALQSTETQRGNGINFSMTPTGIISNTGNGEAFSIMPPYTTVFAWHRTA